MPILDLADDTYVVAAPTEVAARLGRAQPCPWWPDVRLTVTRDRGVKGVQWSVAGALVGSAEIWLEPVAEGTVVHLYLRADLSAGPVRGGAADRERHRRTVAWKAYVHALKDELEQGRRPGEPPPR